MAASATGGHMRVIVLLLIDGGSEVLAWLFWRRRLDCGDSGWNKGWTLLNVDTH